MRFLAAMLCASAAPLAAEAPVLALPIDCTLGTTCYIEDYVDADPTPGKQQDFSCGLNARDAHKGTDFALLSFDSVAQGIEVRAAAPGTVLRVRDGMVDDITMPGVTDQNACGNAAILDHGDGWQTMYCHMREGSLAVAPGDEVATGDSLGLVGLSGMTTHPHVHLTVYHNGKVVDPFATDGAQTCDSQPTRTLWADPPTYYKTGLMTAGFSINVPSLDDVNSGAARVTRTAPDQTMVVYAHAAYAQSGDMLRIEASGPEGEVFAKDIRLDNPRISTMQAFGRKAPRGGWPTGEYLGQATLTRDGTIIAHRFAHMTVD